MPEPEPDVEVLDRYEGLAKLETYTVVPGRRGSLGVIVARAPSGARIMAVANIGDEKTLSELFSGDVFGRPVQITQMDERRNCFRFANSD